MVLDDGNRQMFGEFTWTYEEGDFENGSGAFVFLEIPFTGHDHTDLEAVFDLGSSIEITLPGSVHDDGVDISLFLQQPLTPESGSPLDLDRSAYEIGGNGFHVGAFVSGSIEPSGLATLGVGVGSPAGSLTASPIPFTVSSVISYSVPRPSHVRVSVHDVRGRLVATLVDRWQPAGRHTVPWNGAELESGVYFVRYVDRVGVRTRRAVLVD